MADSAWAAGAAPALAGESNPARHALFVRVTHWISAICLLALLVTGFELVISHPRFYWGETGNVLTSPLFKIPIPASRGTVPTGYGYVLPDQNGWSRALHFQAAWVLMFAGAFYLMIGLGGHFQRNLFPARTDLSARTIGKICADHLRLRPLNESQRWSYNTLQRLTYLFVIFVLSPLAIWTGLAMSPGFVAAFPATVSSLGGQQSARTIHFFVSLALLGFIAVHVAMVFRAGFVAGVRAMITGAVSSRLED